MKRIAAGLALTVILQFAALGQQNNPVTAWTKTGSMTTFRVLHSATLLSDGRVIVLGGQGDVTAGSVAEIYDPASGSWKQSRLARPLYGSKGFYEHTATVLRNGTVLVVSQWSSDDGQTTTIAPAAQIFDPKFDGWRITATPLTYRFGYSAALMSDGRVLVTGGTQDLPSSAEIFDPATESWSLTTPLPYPFANHSSVLLANGEVLIVGDAGAAVYTPSTRAWRLTGNLPVPSVGSLPPPALRLPNGRVLVTTNRSSTVAPQLLLFDPATDAWLRVEQERLVPNATATLLANGLVLFTGGGSLGGSLNTSMLFDPSTSTFKNTWPMSAPRFWHTATLMSNGKVLAAGGADPVSFFGTAALTAEIFDPLAVVPIVPPALSSITPSAALSGATATLATVKGEKFRPESLLRMGTADVDSTMRDTQTLDVSIAENALKTVGPLNVSVSNPGNGGGSSNSIVFNVGATGRDLPSFARVATNVDDPFDTYQGLFGTRLDLAQSFSTPVESVRLVPSGSILDEGGVPIYFGFRTVLAGPLYFTTPVPILAATALGTCWCTASGSPLTSHVAVFLASLPPLPFYTPPPEVREPIIRTGYVTITPSTSTDTLQASATYLRYVESPYELVKLPVSASPVSTRYRLLGAARPRQIAGVAIANLGTTINTITATLKNPQALSQISPIILTIQPNQQIAKLVGELFPNVSSTDSAPILNLELEGSAAFAAMGLTFGASPFDTRPLDMESSALNGRIVFPQFVIGGGWGTELVLTNNSASTVTGRIDIFDSNGSPMNVTMNGITKSSFGYSIPAKESLPLSPRNFQK